MPVARGLWLELSGSAPKCVSEELHNNVVVLAHYYSFYGDVDDVNGTVTPSISVKVTSPYGNTLYSNEKVTHGQFGFTTTEAGNYVACFTLDGDHHTNNKVSVGIDWKVGIAAKDWDSVAKKDKIEGLDLEMRKLVDSVQAIRDNLNYLTQRELELREVSETANARVAWFSIMSISICIGVSGLQVLYLRQYFRKKKLI